MPLPPSSSSNRRRPPVPVPSPHQSTQHHTSRDFQTLARVKPGSKSRGSCRSRLHQTFEPLARVWPRPPDDVRPLPAVPLKTGLTHLRLSPATEPLLPGGSDSAVDLSTLSLPLRYR